MPAADQAHLPVASPTEEQGEIGKHQMRREGRHGHDQRIAIADMGQLVGITAASSFLFSACIRPEVTATGTVGARPVARRWADPFRGCRPPGPAHCCCCKVGVISEAGCALAVWRRTLHQLVGVPPGQQVHDRGNGQGDDRAAGTPSTNPPP